MQQLMKEIYVAVIPSTYGIQTGLVAMQGKRYVYFRSFELQVHYILFAIHNTHSIFDMPEFYTDLEYSQ